MRDARADPQWDDWGYEVHPPENRLQGTGSVVIGRIARFYLQLLLACSDILKVELRGGRRSVNRTSGTACMQVCASVPQQPVALIVKRIPRVSSAGEL